MIIYAHFLKLNYLEHISDQPITDDGYSTLPKRGTIQVVVWVEHTPHHSKADDTVQIKHHETQNSHPNQRTTYQRKQNKIIKLVNRFSPFKSFEKKSLDTRIVH